MYTNTTQYLRALASDLVHGCRRTAADGTVIYTPDGTASYDGLWLRDFSYMVEYAGFAIPDQDIVNCIRYAVRHRRADGWMPDRVTTDGLAVYAAGIAAAPVGEANLDNTPFLIFTVDSLSRRMDTDAFLPLFTEWEAVLEQGLFLLPLDENGLVYNDVQTPPFPLWLHRYHRQNRHALYGIPALLARLPYDGAHVQNLRHQKSGPLRKSCRICRAFPFPAV